MRTVHSGAARLPGSLDHFAGSAGQEFTLYLRSVLPLVESNDT